MNCDEYNFQLQKNGYTDIRWYVNDSFITQAKSFSYKMEDTGTYVVKSVTNTCKVDSVYDTLHVRHLNMINISSFGQLSACESDTLLLPDAQFTGNIGSVSYHWQVDSSLHISHGVTDQAQFKIWFDSLKPQSQRTVSLTITDSANCSNTREIDILPLYFKSDTFFNDLEVCSHEEFLDLGTLSGNPKQSFYGASVVDNKAYTTLMTNGLNRVYSKKEDNKFCYLDSAFVKLKQSPVVDAGVDFEICHKSEPVQLSPIPSGGKWVNSPVDKSNTFTPDHLSIGRYPLVYFYKDTVVGCSNLDTAFATITNSKPLIEIPETLTFCSNNPDEMVYGKPAGGRWTGNMIDPSRDSFLVKPEGFNGPRFQFYYYYKNEAGCDNKDTLTVLIEKAPKVDFELQDSVFQKSETIQITNNTSHPNPLKFTWYVGTPPIYSTIGRHPEFRIDSIGKYDIKMVAFDNETGCSDSLTMEAAVRVTASTRTLGKTTLLSFWPNPNSGVLFVNNAGKDFLKVSVLSVEGKEVMALNCGPGMSKHTISQLEAGVYLLHEKSSGMVLRQRVILE